MSETYKSASSYASDYRVDILAIVELMKEGVLAAAPIYLRPFINIAWSFIISRIVPAVSRETLLKFAADQRKMGYPMGAVAALKGLEDEDAIRAKN